METRLFPRLEISLKIISRVDKSASPGFSLAVGESFEVRSSDISELGIGIISKYFLPKGLILQLDINGEPFGLKEIMKTKGEVRHCSFVKEVGYRCGIKFIGLADSYRKAIAEFISNHERRKAPRVKLSD